MADNYIWDRDKKLDKTLLFLRRTFLVLLIFFVIWIIVFRFILWNDKDKENINITWSNNIENIETKIDETKLVDESEYEISKNKVYYKWDEVLFADADSFKVLDENEIKRIDVNLINSSNLLAVFADYKTRLVMMKQIDGIIKDEKNVTRELFKSSEQWMYKMENDYDNLSKFTRRDRYDMTNEQRAKFAIMFLYIKIIKSKKNSEINMKTALYELKSFLENMDKDKLEKESIEDENDKWYLQKIKWDWAMDKHCMYIDWELYACILDDLFK